VEVSKLDKTKFSPKPGVFTKRSVASLDKSKKNGFLGVYFWEIEITFIIVISNPLGSELFISLFWRLCALCALSG